jgi:hypothetical protein
MQLRPLPSKVADLLVQTKAPPRLRVHLCLVHDTACQLTANLRSAWPKLVIDEQAVHLGAAIHDIGKVIHPDELNEPGFEHEDAGRTLLLELGWSASLARFPVTHARKLDANDPIEDLLVAIADKVWKGKRDEALEQSLLAHIALLSGQAPWQVWLTLDEMLTNVAELSPERLRLQASHY